MIWLLACAERIPLVDESRALASVPGPERTWTWRATLRGWHHGAGWDHGPQLARDDLYVGWEVQGEGAASVRGEVDQVTAFSAMPEARAGYDALAVESCADAEHLAFRMTGETRFRVVVPDVAGAAVGPTPAEDCALALAWTGTSAEWRRDRSAGVRICQHLHRLGNREDAIRCELRETLPPAQRPASRQDLPTAPDDPRFERDLLAVLGPDAEGDRSAFAPYRVLQLLHDVDDRAAVRALAEALAARPERAPWRAAVLAEAGSTALGGWVDQALGGSSDADAAIVELGLRSLTDHHPDAVGDRAAQAAEIGARTSCGPESQVLPGQCPDPAGYLRGR